MGTARVTPHFDLPARVFMCAVCQSTVQNREQEAEFSSLASPFLCAGDWCYCVYTAYARVALPSAQIGVGSGPMCLNTIFSSSVGNTVGVTSFFEKSLHNSFFKKNVGSGLTFLVLKCCAVFFMIIQLVISKTNYTWQLCLLECMSASPS